jgi:hypothetical protein
LKVFSTCPLLYAARSSGTELHADAGGLQIVGHRLGDPECTTSQVKSPASKPLG